VDVDLLGRDALSIPMTGVMNVEREDIMLMIALEAEGVVVEEAGGQIPVIGAIQEAEVGAEDAMIVIVHVAGLILAGAVEAIQGAGVGAVDVIRGVTEGRRMQNEEER